MLFLCRSSILFQQIVKNIKNIKNTIEKIKIENIFYFQFLCRFHSILLVFPANSFSKMQQVTRSVASEITVYFNFGFSGVNMDSSNISQSNPVVSLLYTSKRNESVIPVYKNGFLPSNIAI